MLNCSAVPARLFVTGGLEIQSEEGTTQGDPVAMPLYAISTVALLKTVIGVAKEKRQIVKHVAFAQTTSKVVLN